MTGSLSHRLLALYDRFAKAQATGITAASTRGGVCYTEGVHSPPVDHALVRHLYLGMSAGAG